MSSTIARNGMQVSQPTMSPSRATWSVATGMCSDGVFVRLESSKHGPCVNPRQRTLTDRAGGDVDNRHSTGRASDLVGPDRTCLSSIGNSVRGGAEGIASTGDRVRPEHLCVLRTGSTPPSRRHSIGIAALPEKAGCRRWRERAAGRFDAGSGAAGSSLVWAIPMAS